MLNGLRVLISGAGIAGPALATRLTSYGAEVTVAEIAPALRQSGFAVDFRGPTHMAALEHLGVLHELKAVQTHGAAMRCENADGTPIWELPASFTGGDIEVYRADLSRILTGRSQARYLFAESITHLAEHPTHVSVTFTSGRCEDFHLVIGADGIHSRVRQLTFGPERGFVRHLGYHIAGWDLANSFGSDPVSRQYAQPGRMASFTPDQRNLSRATALFVFESSTLDIDWLDLTAQKQLLTSTFTGLPWHVPALLETLDAAPELYFDAIARVSVPHWHRGRVALLGDAAWGVTLGGMGVGTGIVGAHILAGELAQSGGGHETAYQNYERRMRKYAATWQRGASPGKFLAPATGKGLWLRNKLFASNRFKRFLLGSTKAAATGEGLPVYQ